jgi:spore maturation protein SpmB
MSTMLLKRSCVALVSVALLSLAAPVPVQAEIISTGAAMAHSGRAASLATIRAALSRQEVAVRLGELGVAPADIDARLAALTNEELASLAARIDEAPAGGDVLAVLGIVFIVLLVLEFAGAIDIFKKVP